MDIMNESKYVGRQQAYQSRAGAAQRWARRMLWFTAALGLFAVWQHRELAPPVHDGMFVVAAVSKDIWGGAHETRNFVQNFLSSSSDSTVQRKYNGSTQWFLDNR